MSWSVETSVALDAARVAARILRQSQPELRVRHKGAVDLVTQIDLACERAIRDFLAVQTPNIPVMGEEGGGAEDAVERWVVDPLDGTTNFVHGFPVYGVSVALEIDQTPVVGVIIDPVRNVEYAGATGAGAYANGQRMQVSDCDDIADALIATGFPYDRRERPGFYLGYVRRVLAEARGVRRAGAASIDLALVASGRLDGFWEFSLKRWDVAAGIVLASEAGGVVSGINGGALDLDNPCPLIANPRLHDRLRRVVNGL